MPKAETKNNKSVYLNGDGIKEILGVPEQDRLKALSEYANQLREKAAKIDRLVHILEESKAVHGEIGNFLETSDGIEFNASPNVLKLLSKLSLI